MGWIIQQTNEACARMSFAVCLVTQGGETPRPYQVDYLQKQGWEHLR